MASQIQNNLNRLKRKIKDILKLTVCILTHTTYYPLVQLSYIQTDGNQHIVTGVTVNSNITVEMDFETVSTGSGFGRVWGTSSDMKYELCDTKSTSNYRIAVNGASYQFNATGRKKIKMTGNGQIYLNDALIKNFATSYSGQVLWLFAGNGTSERGKVRMYDCKIWSNDILIRHYIPAIDYNNVVCLYDEINDNYIYNSGSGSFVGGGVVE